MQGPVASLVEAGNRKEEGGRGGRVGKKGALDLPNDVTGISCT